MSSIRVNFNNSNDLQLSAKLELPDHQTPHNFAIFAHCFTCSKNLNAVKSIAHSLTQAGFGVLRFDFTGLGQSEGDFKETNFSSNISDLICAANYLETNYSAPTLIIGHSLGGAAAIYAAGEIKSIEAVASIGAPSAPQHVKHLFESYLDKIEGQGEARVSIGGRPFTVKKSFLEDLESKEMSHVVKHLRKPILVIHSPQDDTVGIENAKEIYQNAMHPKSFVSVDKADHLLSKSNDSLYVGKVIAGWASRYVTLTKKERVKSPSQVAVSLGNEGFTSDVFIGKHTLTADEPQSVGGMDFGPAPYDFVSSGLAACTAMTLRMYANRKSWNLEKIMVHVDHHKIEVENEDGGSSKVDCFKRKIELEGDLTETQELRLLQIADKCPVHKTLENSSKVETELIHQKN